MRIDVWELLFELDIDLEFSLDFEIETTGSTGRDSSGNLKRESKKLASVSVPLELFSISVDYSLQTEFDETPIKIKGTLDTKFTLGFGTHPVQIRNYRTSVKVKELTLKNPERDKNNGEPDREQNREMMTLEKSEY